MFIHTLKQALKQADVDLTDHRIDLISRLVCALVQVRSVNLKKLACSLSGAAQIESHYRRLQRFFSSRVSPGIFTQLIVSKLVRPGQSVLLVLDRTHWMLGQDGPEYLMFRPGVSGRVYSIRVSVPGKAGQFQYAGKKTDHATGPDLSKNMLVHPVSRSRIHRQSLVLLSAGAPGRLCHPPEW